MGRRHVPVRFQRHGVGARAQARGLRIAVDAGLRLVCLPAPPDPRRVEGESARGDGYLAHAWSAAGHLDAAGKGTEWLTRELWRARPRLVVFGHIHEARGIEEMRWGYEDAVYDGVNCGEKGLVSVLAMALVVIWQRVLGGVSGSAVGSTTLVNAAVVAGRGNLESRLATIVEI